MYILGQQLSVCVWSEDMGLSMVSFCLYILLVYKTDYILE